MPSGSCLCGKATVSYEGEPVMKALCHCNDCKKLSGSVYSTNVVVNEDTFKSAGPLKEFKKIGDSGNPITTYFCPDCGCTLFRESQSMPGLKIIRAGSLDGNALDKEGCPQAELYAPMRNKWVPKIEGTVEKETM